VAAEIPARPKAASGASVTFSSGLRILALRIVALAAILGLWQLLVYVRVLDPLYFSMPSEIGQRAVKWSLSGILVENLWVTFSEALIGWCIAAVLGIVGGYLTASWKTLDAVVSPFVDAFVAAPRLALVPLFVIWFGLGSGSKVALVVALVAVLIFVTTNGAAKSVDQDFVILARTLGARRLEMATKVVWPWCLPFIFTSLRVGMSLGITSATVGEMIIAEKGLGTLIAREAGAFDTTGVLTAVGIVMVVAYTMSVILTSVEKRVLRWRPDGMLAQ
jgi:NitT/TauT family transport system permease protein